MHYMFDSCFIFEFVFLKTKKDAMVGYIVDVIIVVKGSSLTS